jgi:hypothetical protein
VDNFYGIVYGIVYGKVICNILTDENTRFANQLCSKTLSDKHTSLDPTESAMTTLQPDMTADQIAEEVVEEMTDNNVVEVIETVISSLDSDNSAMVSQSDGGHIWKFKYGTVEVFVQLTGESEEDMLTAWSSVLKLPARDEAQLTRHLLELNWQSTLEARYGIVDDQVVVLVSRTLADLSPGEISRAITIVATIADENDEPLQQKFGAA